MNMKNSEDQQVVVNKSNLDLDNFYENKFEINLNRVSFIFIAIFIYLTLNILLINQKKYSSIQIKTMGYL